MIVSSAYCRRRDSPAPVRRRFASRRARQDPQPRVRIPRFAPSPVAVPLDAATLAALPRETVAATAHDKTAAAAKASRCSALLRASGVMPAEPLRGPQLAQLRAGRPRATAIARCIHWPNWNPRSATSNVLLVDSLRRQAAGRRQTARLRLIAPRRIATRALGAAGAVDHRGGWRHERARPSKAWGCAARVDLCLTDARRLRASGEMPNSADLVRRRQPQGIAGRSGRRATSKAQRTRRCACPMRPAPRSRARSSRARRPTCSSPPTSTGWTTLQQRRPDRRRHAPRTCSATRWCWSRRSDSAAKPVRTRAGIDLLPRARRRRPHRAGADRQRARGQVRQGRVHLARHVGRAASPASPRPRTCAPRCCWWRAARRRWAWSTAATRKPSRACGCVGDFPARSHPPIVYPVARIAASTHPQARGVRALAAHAGGGGDLPRARLHGARWRADAHVAIHPRRTDRDRAEPQGRERRRARQPAVRHRARLAAGAQALPRQVPARCAGAPAAGVAAGGGRLCAAGDLRQPRARSARCCAIVRHRLRVPLDRRGAGQRGHGLPADGARDPAVDRSRRPSPRTGRCARSAPRPWRVFFTHHLAAGAGRASSPARCWPSPRRWANSAPPSPSSPTFPAKRRRCPRRSTACCRCRAAKPAIWRLAIVVDRRSRCWRCWLSEWLVRRATRAARQR